MRPADPRERPLIAQERVQPPVVAGQDLAQRSIPSPSASGPRCASSASRLPGCLEPHAGPLLLACLGKDDLTAVLDRPEGGDFGPFAPGVR